MWQSVSSWCPFCLCRAHAIVICWRDNECVCWWNTSSNYRVLTFLNQHGSGQSMHYIADTQEQPSHRCDICKWGGVEVERVCLSELHWYSLARSTSCHVTQIGWTIPRPFLKPHWESSSCGLMMVWRHSSRMRERTFLGILSNVMPP